MPSTSRVAAAVAAGYMLGRTKKLKLAITVGTMLAGKRLASKDTGALLRTLSENPEIKRLEDQLRGRLMDAAKAAAVNVATSRVEAITASLRDGGAKDEDSEEEDEYDEDEYADEETDEPEDSDESDEPEDSDESDEEPRRPRKAAAKKSPAKKAPAKRAPAKKAPAKKTAAKKTAAAGSAAKRTSSRATTTKGAAKKTTARSRG
ncbi:hypothetical protein [Nocardioides sp. AN3]